MHRFEIAAFCVWYSIHVNISYALSRNILELQVVDSTIMLLCKIHLIARRRRKRESTIQINTAVGKVPAYFAAVFFVSFPDKYKES